MNWHGLRSFDTPRCSRALLVCGAFVLLSTLVACGGGTRKDAVSPVGNQQAGVNPTAGFNLAFPTDRSADTLTAHTLLGNEDEQRSSGAFEQGTSLLLPAGANGVEFAIYRFHVSSSPDHVDIALDAAQTTDAYIGIADFNAQRWEFNGPFSTGQTLPIDAGYGISPLGNVFVAVVTAQGGTAKIDQLQLFATNLSPTVILTGTPDHGDSPLTVLLDATGSTDPDGSIVKYEWDVDGDGIYELDTGTDPQTQQVLTMPGIHTIRVRATDDSGEYGTASADVTLPGWAIVVVDSSSGQVGKYSSLAVVNGHPAIAYRDVSNAALKYAYSSDLDGVTGWTALSIDSVGGAGNYPSLTVINGYPAISYCGSFADGLKYATCTATDGSAGWKSLVVDGAAGVGQYTSLKLVAGCPAISYYDYGNGDLKYARSSSADGSSDWRAQTIDSAGSVGWWTTLLVVNGSPAISYYDVTRSQLKYAYSSSPDGSNNWTAIDVGTKWGEYPSMAIVNGHPAISQQHSLYDHLQFAYSDSVDGSSGWEILPADQTYSVGYYSSLAVINGNPAISYGESVGIAPPDLKYASNSQQDGSGGWSAVTIDRAGIDLFCSLAEVNGHPAISYFDENLLVLKYAVLVGP